MENILKEKLEELKAVGFEGNSLAEAKLFCAEQINEYWVDAPVSERDEEMKAYAKKCNEFKKILKELKKLEK